MNKSIDSSHGYPILEKSPLWPEERHRRHHGWSPRPGLQFNLRSAQGKLMAAEFEKDLLRERVRSGIAAAQKRGVVFGRRPGQRVKADRFAPKVLKLVGAGQSYREISHRLGLSKNTVL